MTGFLYFSSGIKLITYIFLIFFLMNQIFTKYQVSAQAQNFRFSEQTLSAFLPSFSEKQQIQQNWPLWWWHWTPLCTCGREGTQTCGTGSHLTGGAELVVQNGSCNTKGWKSRQRWEQCACLDALPDTCSTASLLLWTTPTRPFLAESPLIPAGISKTFVL